MLRFLQLAKRILHRGNTLWQGCQLAVEIQQKRFKTRVAVIGQLFKHRNVLGHILVHILDRFLHHTQFEHFAFGFFTDAKRGRKTELRKMALHKMKAKAVDRGDLRAFQLIKGRKNTIFLPRRILDRFALASQIF